MGEWRRTLAGCAVAATICLLAWRLANAPAGDAASTRVSNAQRREQQRERRRQQKDLQLTRKRKERAAERLQQERVMSDEQKRERIERTKMQRVEQYQKMDDGLVNGLRVVVDLAFAQDQTERECNSIFKQLGCAYGYMKKCPLDRVISLRVASYAGETAVRGQRHGLPQWKIHLHEEPIESVYHPEDIIYLSPDADDVLLQLDANAVYVIGGIVDRSVRKGQSIGKASGNHYRAMRLPLQEYMDVRKPVLNIDNVLIALNEFANHCDWTRAFEVATPKRMATRKGTD